MGANKFILWGTMLRVCVWRGGGGGGSKDELSLSLNLSPQPIPNPQKIIMSSSVLCKNYFEGFLSYPTFFFFTYIVVI